MLNYIPYERLCKLMVLWDRIGNVPFSLCKRVIDKNEYVRTLNNYNNISGIYSNVNHSDR